MIRPPQTLFVKTGITVTIALVLFMIFAVSVTSYYVLVPLGRRAADDLAALMIHSARDWTMLKEEARPPFESELLESDQLKISAPEATVAASRVWIPYLLLLENAFHDRLGRKIAVQICTAQTNWYCVDLPVSGQTVQISFPRSRIGPQPPKAVLLLAAGGTIAILLTTLLLVRRLTDPLTRLSEATSRVARGETHQLLPVTGPAEIAELTRSFNRMEQEISELLANRTTLFAGISHDLRSPITRMQLALEMLLEQPDPVLVERLRGDLEKMNRLISETMELARGLETREPEEIDLRDFIDGIVTDYRDADAGIDWVPDDCCVCCCDTLALRRVLSNLIDNAVRYGGDTPPQVRCGCDPREAVIEVVDSGTGIPESEREAVFQPFHRLETSRSRRTGGSGLGLAIARQLCDVHGWSIELSTNTGGGTLARLRMPRGQAAGTNSPG